MSKELFIILSLKHSEGNTPCFWKSNDAGYTIFPWAAGIYSKESIEASPSYYNNGYDTIAIPLTNEGLESIGFHCKMDPAKLDKVSRKTIAARNKKEVPHV